MKQLMPLVSVTKDSATVAPEGEGEGGGVSLREELTLVGERVEPRL